MGKSSDRTIARVVTSTSTIVTKQTVFCSRTVRVGYLEKWGTGTKMIFYPPLNLWYQEGMTLDEVSEIANKP